MYESFFGLEEKPFNLTPDPKYLFLSDNHKEAFAHLLFGIKNRSGFVMVTGEIGTGKTTICRTLLNQLDDETEVAFIFNTSLSPLELIKKINTEFGIVSGGADVQDLIDQLNEYLLEATHAGKKCVLVVDEAQNLSPQVLEQVRLLSNLETETEKLLQIVLIGQPELAEKLQLHELRQLNQRITARYHLKPLTQKEAQQYINYRLHTAGARRKNFFARGALASIYRASGGTPRVINAICDRSLLIAYTKELPIVGRKHVQQAIKEIKGERVHSRAWSWHTVRDWMPSPSLLVAAALVIVVVLGFQGIMSQYSSLNQFLVSEAQRSATAQGEVATAATVTPPASEARETTLAELASAAEATAPVPTGVTGDVAAGNTSARRAATTSASFSEVMEQAASADTRRAAVAAVFPLWGVETPATPVAGDAVEHFAEFARRHGFAHEALTPALDQLLSIGLPAFVQITTTGGERWVALTRTQGQDLELSTVAGATATISREDFREVYAGRAVIFWRDTAPQTPVLRQGRSGETVAALKEQLRRLERLPANNQSVQYDNETAAAVAKLQAETGLDIDGVAGRQVRMVLSSWAPSIPTPGLNADTQRMSAVPAPNPVAPPARASRTPAAPRAEAPQTPVAERAAEAETPADAAPPPETPAPVEAAPAAPPQIGQSFRDLMSDASPPRGGAETPPAAVHASDAGEAEAGLPTDNPMPITAMAGDDAADAVPEAADPPAEAVEDAPANQIQMQELPEPRLAELPPAELEALKETTPPASSGLPLVPHEPGS